MTEFSTYGERKRQHMTNILQPGAEGSRLLLKLQTLAAIVSPNEAWSSRSPTLLSVHSIEGKAAFQHKLGDAKAICSQGPQVLFFQNELFGKLWKLIHSVYLWVHVLYPLLPTKLTPADLVSSLVVPWIREKHLLWLPSLAGHLVQTLLLMNYICFPQSTGLSHSHYLLACP